MRNSRRNWRNLVEKKENMEDIDHSRYLQISKGLSEGKEHISSFRTYKHKKDEKSLVLHDQASKKNGPPLSVST